MLGAGRSQVQILDETAGEVDRNLVEEDLADHRLAGLKPRRVRLAHCDVGAVVAGSLLDMEAADVDGIVSLALSAMISKR